ncbi:uncharacterized protein F4807DRAFT_439801 [Annulohypoxylon truncatum]|uniref:uncharacterized protein n=1 Tax=Annulohypoxylon truncatum TaxID=327061 RepID=UPI0020088CF9|nr:uncharacterized protein F4807DRAFT_439801 [Annulohypoxylon truncatum]KAI1206363.1 hypothetical protein F4807DRAFT_439801 [Annulohypoxylon truncatum]
MSPQVSSSDSQSRSIERAEPLKPTGRLRSACDSCHRAKIRCSGGNPCVTCLVSQANCSYSPGNRLGRPKGSKNKRFVVKEDTNRRGEAPGSKYAKGTVDRRVSEPGPRGEAQQQSDPMPVEFDLGHGFHAGITEDLFNPSFSSFFDTIGGSHVHTSPEGDSNATFTRITNTEDQSPYQDLAFGTPSSACDSGYATTTISSYAEDIESQSTRSVASARRHKHLGIGPPIPQEPTHCSCLQQQVQLVYQLGDLQCSDAGNPTVDSVLRGVQLAQIPWKAIMECKRCQREEGQKEGFLLFATSIRILLSLFQKLNAISHSDGTFPESAGGQTFPFALDVEVSIGNFKLIGGTKEEVVRVVIRRALQSVTTALLHLWERVDRPRPSPTTDQRGGGGTDAGPESSTNILTRKETDLQESGSSDFPPNFGAHDIGALLNSLYAIMRAIKQDL